MWDAVVASAANCGVGIKPNTRQRISGGSINEAWRVESDAGALFVKSNSALHYDMLVAEAAGLSELARPDVIRVPKVICAGSSRDKCFLVLEFLDLRPVKTSVAAKLGDALARLHRERHDYFGWHRDNTIGTTPQINTANADWISFFRHDRLKFQLSLARCNGAERLANQGETLCEHLPHFFAGIETVPVLLHGDLWSGNWGSCNNEPVVFDPAVYYGDAESDIAMTELFGGFPPAFYDAYRAVHPDLPGGRQRRELYRLYHVLNHYNLFGGGYANQAGQIITALLAEI